MAALKKVLNAHKLKPYNLRKKSTDDRRVARCRKPLNDENGILKGSCFINFLQMFSRASKDAKTAKYCYRKKY